MHASALRPKAVESELRYSEWNQAKGDFQARGACREDQPAVEPLLAQQVFRGFALLSNVYQGSQDVWHKSEL